MHLKEYSYIYPSDKFPFAHFTLQKRFPKILRDILDNTVFENPAVPERLKHLHDNIQLHRVILLDIKKEQEPYWQAFFSSYLGKPLSAVPFFYCEIYFYQLILELTDYEKNLIDPFFTLKKEEIEKSLPDFKSFDARRMVAGWDLNNYILFSLLGNKADLSQFNQYEDIQLTNLILDDRDQLIDAVNQKTPVHLILDNAGTELFYDLALASYLITTSGTPVVYLYPKWQPLLVSDATETDLHYLLEQISQPAALAIAREISNQLATGKLVIRNHPFWNTPNHFTALPEDLLSLWPTEDLIICKGDANYRRFFEDRWIPPTTPIDTLELGFTNQFFALRTLKSEIMVGLEEKELTLLTKQDPEWMTNGQHSIIQKIN